MRLSPYHTYQQTNLEWAESLPEHWLVKPLKRNVELLTEKTDSNEFPVGLENIEGWTGRFLETKTEFQGEGVGFEANNILFGKLRPYLAKVWLAERKGEAVGDFHVLRPLSENVPGFVKYQLLAREVIDLINGSTYGAKMPRASWDFLGSLGMPTPSEKEQGAIANFLDRETAKVDALVAEQERLIELLQEKRQAVISHAVTKGLNPDVRMKDSGVEWLGKVPEHWKTMPIRRLLESLSQGSSPTCLQDPAEEGKYGVLKVGCVNQFEFLPGENKGLPEDETPDLTSAVLQGDVLMSRGNTRELVGLAAVVQEEVKGLLASDLIFILRFKEALVLPEFATLFLRSDLGRCQIEPQTVGTSASMQKINQSTIKGLTIVLPPLNEQREISESMNRITKKFSDEIDQSSLAIELLQERRSALISAAVTGQIDVRGLVPEEEVAA